MSRDTPDKTEPLKEGIVTNTDESEDAETHEEHLVEQSSPSQGDNAPPKEVTTIDLSESKAAEPIQDVSPEVPTPPRYEILLLPNHDPTSIEVREVSQFQWLISLDLRYWLVTGFNIVGRAHNDSAEVFQNDIAIYEYFQEAGYQVQPYKNKKLSVSEDLAMRLYACLRNDAELPKPIHHALILGPNGDFVLVVNIGDMFATSGPLPSVWPTRGVEYPVIGHIVDDEPRLFAPESTLKQYLRKHKSEVMFRWADEVADQREAEVNEQKAAKKREKRKAQKAKAVRDGVEESLRAG